MKIRGRKPTAVCSVSLSPSPPPPPPPPSSSSSSSALDSSSITASHSLASFQDSSNSCPFSLSAAASHRCHGLDLLVKAIHQVTAGSVVGVPYIQRRVTIRRRRRRGLDFDAFLFDELSERKREGIAKEVSNIDNNSNKKNKKKKGKNLKGLRSRIQESVLQPWGRMSDLAGQRGL